MSSDASATPIYDRWGVRLFHGDNLEALRSMDDASIDSVVTDPPAGVRFMNRAWDSDMGGRHQWVAWLSERMSEAYRVLKPGGYALVWALPRTSHWTAWALEDAGFEVRDCVTHLFGTGFPKSLDIGKSLDKLNGRNMEQRYALARHIRDRRDSAGVSRAAIAAAFPQYREVTANWERTDINGNRVPTPSDWSVLAPWLGLDAAWLPLVQRVEAERQVVGIRRGAQSQSTGRYGGWGKDDGTGRSTFDDTIAATDAARQWDGWGTALKPASEHWWLCRKPITGTVAANVLEHGTGGLNIGACRVATTDDLNGGAYSARGSERYDGTDLWRYKRGGAGNYSPPSGRWPSNVVLYHAVTCTEADCDESCPVAELNRQSGVTKSGVHAAPESGRASRFFQAFRWEEKAPASERPRVDGESWPTVKPVDLMRYLIRLVTPPGGTVLDLFAGTGTTGQAARAEGMSAVLIEQDDTAIKLIRARLDARARTEAPTEPGTKLAPADDHVHDLLDLLGDAS